MHNQKISCYPDISQTGCHNVVSLLKMLEESESDTGSFCTLNQKPGLALPYHPPETSGKWDEGYS